MPQHHKYANPCLFELAVDRQCDAASSPRLVALLSSASLKSVTPLSPTHVALPLSPTPVYTATRVSTIEPASIYPAPLSLSLRNYLSAIAIERPPAEREKIIIPISCSISVGGEMIQ